MLQPVYKIRLIESPFIDIYAIEKGE